MPADPPLSFAKSLFFGLLRPDALRPFPRPDAEERETMAMLLESYSQWAAETLDGAKFDAEHEVPASVREGMAELGVLGLSVPEEHGGAGLSYSTYCRILEETNRHCASSAVILGGHQSIGIKAVLLAGTDEQKARWLPKLATGEWFAAFALSEPQAGSDPASMECRAEPSEDGASFVLTGQKIWCTNGAFADFLTVFALTPSEDGRGRVSCFALTPDETSQAAFQRGQDEDKLGLRGSSTTQLFLDGVVVPKENLIGQQGKGLRVAFEVLNYGRTSLAAGCAGSQKAIYAHAVQHANERVQFGRPIAEFEMVAAKLAEMAADIYATETIAYATAAMADRGDADFSVEAAICKVYGTESCWRTCNHAVQVAGGIAYVREYPYERFLRDARINMIFEGTNEILHHFIAMSGLRAPSDIARAESEAASSGGSGALRGGRLREVARDRFGGEDSFGEVPAILAAEVESLERLTPALGLAVEHVLAEHGPAILEKQLVQERLADCAIHLYVGFACASRAAEALEGGAAAESDEIAIARHAIRTAARRAEESLAALREADDRPLLAAAQAARRNAPWPFDPLP